MDSRDVVLCFFEKVWNGRDLALLDEIVYPDCRTHQLSSDADAVGTVRGPAELRDHIGAWLSAFPDLTVGIDQMIAERDRVATFATLRGTHCGPWMALKPTGRSVQIRMATIHLVRAGRIAADWVLVESYGFFHQLGLVPAKTDLLVDAR